MNILFVVLSLDVGGLERLVIQLIQQLKLQGHTVKLCCLEREGALIDDVKSHDIEVFNLQKAAGIKLSVAWKISKLVRANQIDIIHTHNSAAHFYGALAHILTRVPILHTKHGRNRPDDKSVVWLNYIASTISNSIVTVSKDAALLTIELEGVNPKKVRVIPNGIDLSKYSDTDEKARALAFSSGNIRLGHVGRFSNEKNQNLLFETFARFLKQYPKAELYMVGDGPRKEELNNVASKLGITNNVRFTGVVDNVHEYLKTFHWFVLSSLTEGMPLAVIEAMAAGLPVVSTDVGGVSEVVKNGVTGAIVPSRDSDAMLHAWIDLAENYQKVREYGALGRECVFSEFSVGKMAQRYEEAYVELIS